VLFQGFGKLEGCEMRFHCANGLMVLRILRTLEEALIQKCALLAAMLHHIWYKPGMWSNLFSGRVICRQPKAPATLKISL